jgi:hypothetical protein
MKKPRLAGAGLRAVSYRRQLLRTRPRTRHQAGRKTTSDETLEFHGGALAHSVSNAEANLLPVHH